MLQIATRESTIRCFVFSPAPEGWAGLRGLGGTALLSCPGMGVVVLVVLVLVGVGRKKGGKEGGKEGR